MAELTDFRGQRVVNLADFRAARERLRLPLLEARSEATSGVELPDLAPEAPLLPRQVAHRERMLRHLAGGVSRSS
jgi:hypothetical protein